MRKMMQNASVLRRTALPMAAAAFAMTAGATAANAAGPVYIGAELSDSSTVLPAEFVPGAIVFDLFLLNAQSPGCTSANRVFSDTKAVTGAGTYTSGAYKALNPGVYQWVASYYDTSYVLLARGACPDRTEQTPVIPHPVRTTPSDARPGPITPPACGCPESTAAGGPATAHKPAATEKPAAPAPVH